jgi:outer membrane protein TolC
VTPSFITQGVTWRVAIALLAVLPHAPLLRAQVQPAASADSTVPFPFATFADAVLRTHPVARQAKLAADVARAELRTAWGAFDPTLSASWDQKSFDGTSYYRYFTSELKIPLPIGADVMLAYDRTMGRYINPDRRTAGNGTFAAGVSIPLGQRLITDERRTALEQARAARDLGEADQESLVNKLLFAAAKEYGTWYEAWRKRAIAEEGETLADFRLQAVRRRVSSGESAPIDTVEALLELQRRQVSRYEAEATFYVATLGVTAYLWDDAGRPLALPPGATPVSPAASGVTDSLQFTRALAQAVARHPDLRKAEAKVRQASAQRLFAAQGLLPAVEAKLAGLAERGSDDPFFNDARLGDNFKAGLSAKSPLLFLKESGKFASARQKLDMQRIERDRVERDVEFDVRAAMFELTTLERALAQQTATVRGARLLREAEQVRYENGESTLLVLNLRERLVLDEAGRLAALEAKVVAARGALAVASGDRMLLVPGR